MQSSFSEHSESAGSEGRGASDSLLPGALGAVQLEGHRIALTGHCYRMLGSAVDADDAVQDTMVRAWKSLDRFDGRSSLRTWLYRIATNVCLDALASGKRRARPFDEGPSCSIEDELQTRPRQDWVEPISDARALPAEGDPAQRLLLRQSIRLAFVAALQHLPPKQRAALLLSEVLGWSAAEVASQLEISVAAVNSALQRARATLAARDIGTVAEALSEPQATLLDRYVDAFERYDVDALLALFKQDARLCMPPYTLWLCGHEALRAWWLGPGAGCRGSRLVSTAACGSPAFAQYRPTPEGGHRAWSLIVLDVIDSQVASMTAFLDVETLFPRFDLPLHLPARLR
jgi:RNA polymerase sigma-70 factor (ECF subfamily)